MLDFLSQWIPNVIQYQDRLWLACEQTFVMLFFSGFISLIFGLVFGVILVVTRPGDILENRILYNVIDKIINVFRSIPFIILILMMIPLTRMLVGTSIGVIGAIPPLIVGTVPFFARQIESALSEVDPGLREASIAMGASPMEIIFRVYLKESIPGIVRGTTITFVSLVGLIAMAGAVGAGGLGDFAISYGYQRNMMDIIYVAVFFVLLFVSIIQALGNYIIKKTSH